MLLQLVLLAVLALGAALKAVQLIRSSEGRVLSGALVACLALLALGQALSLPPVSDVLDEVVTLGFGKVAYNAATMGGQYALLCFFACALRGTFNARARLRTDGLVLAVIVTVLAGLIALTPEQYRGHSLSSSYITYPAVALFYVVGGAYFVYIYAISASWMWRYAATSRGNLATALRVMVIGLVGLTITSVVRATYVLIQFAGGPKLSLLNSVNFRVSNTAFILLTIGLVGVGILQIAPTVLAWRTRRVQYRKLFTFWDLTRRTFPEIVLDDVREAPSTRLLRRSRQGAFFRRVMECRDGLVRLGPYIAIAAGGQDVGAASPEETARYIRLALTLRRESEQAQDVDVSPVSVALPAAPGPAADVEVLVAISEALESQIAYATQ